MHIKMMRGGEKIWFTGGRWKRMLEPFHFFLLAIPWWCAIIVPEFLFSSPVFAEAKKKLVLIEDLPLTGDIWDAGLSMLGPRELMLEQINKNPNLLPDYEMEVGV